jgi:hypothetical protein
MSSLIPQVTGAVVPPRFPNVTTYVAGPPEVLPPSSGLFGTSLGAANSAFYGDPPAPETTEKAYKCSFSLQLSLRIPNGARESLEVDGFVLLGELTPIVASNS